MVPRYSNRQLNPPPSHSHSPLLLATAGNTTQKTQRTKVSHHTTFPTLAHFSSFSRFCFSLELSSNGHGYGDIIPAFPATRGRGFFPDTPAQVNIWARSVVSPLSTTCRSCYCSSW